MRVCDTEREFEAIMRFVSPRRSRSIYAYLDLKKYGIGNGVVTAWADSYDEVSSVAMRYHNGIHLCADEGADICDLSYLIAEERPAMVLGERWLIDAVLDKLEVCVRPSYGLAMRAKQVNLGSRDSVERAAPCDACEIAELILSDASIGSGYTIDELTSQITERQRDGYGRNYVIRDGAKIIAHAGTGAELAGAATIVDVIVGDDHRRQGLGRKLVSAISADLVEEGMSPHLFCYSIPAQELYKSVGFEVVCEWARLDLPGAGI